MWSVMKSYEINDKYILQNDNVLPFLLEFKKSWHISHCSDIRERKYVVEITVFC